MSSTILSLLLLLLMPLVANAHEQKPRLILVELDRSKAINLGEYGGPNVEIRMRNREMSYVAIDVVDYTKLIPVARTNVRGVTVDNSGNAATIYGSTDVTMVPTRTSKNIDKRNGIPYPRSHHDMYLVYEEPSSRIKIYFLDSIARQNFDNMVVAIPTREPAPPSPPSQAPAPQMPPVAATPPPSTPPPSRFLSPELASWYAKLQRERQALDLTDSDSVARFNEHAAQYQDALAKARAALDALKFAPRQPSR